MSRKSHKTRSVFNNSLAVGIVMLLSISAVTAAQKSVPPAAAAESISGKPDPDRIIKRRFPQSRGTQTITGMVVDSANSTGQPIANATVTLIQSNGEMTAIETTTNPQGRFVLRVNKHIDIDSDYMAVSVRAENFRPREVNVSTTQNNSIRLSQEHTFNYFRPVQLDDGIQTGHLNDSNLDPDLINQLLFITVQPPGRSYRELHSLLIYKDGCLVVEEICIRADGGIPNGTD